MKDIIKFSIVIVVLGLCLGGIYFLKKTGNVNNEFTDSSDTEASAVVNNPAAKNLLSEVNKFDNKEKWDKERYNDLLSKLSAAESAGTILEKEHDDIKKNLELYYIKQLNFAINNFFDNNCSDVKLFKKLERELNKLKKAYTNNTKKSSVNIKTYNDAVSFISRAKNYSRNNNFKLSTVMNYVKNSRLHSGKGIVKKCPNLVDDLKKIPAAMQRKHLSYLDRLVTKLENEGDNVNSYDIGNAYLAIEKYERIKNYPHMGGNNKIKIDKISERLGDIEYKIRNNGDVNKN